MPGEHPYRLDWSGVTLLGHFRVEGPLASGGMGTVYRAVNLTLGRPVVVKVPDPALLARPGFAARFQLEVEQLVRFSHPNVVPILAAGEHEGTPFLVLEYLAGGSLKDRLERAGGRQAPDEVLAWLGPIAGALDHLHAQQVLHRDVKPGNILFHAVGQPYLSDFGIAKVLDAGRGLTTTGGSLYTPAYAAPEQMRDDTGAAPLTGAVDQYALACTAYEALAGDPPFLGSLSEIAAGKLRDAVPELSARAPHVPAPAAQAVMRALSREPGRRHPSCAAFARAFAQGLAPAPARTAGPGTRAAGSSDAAPTKRAAAGASAPQDPAVDPRSARKPGPSGRRGTLLLLPLALTLGLVGWIVLGRSPGPGAPPRPSAKEGAREEAVVAPTPRPDPGPAPRPEPPLEKPVPAPPVDAEPPVITLSTPAGPLLRVSGPVARVTGRVTDASTVTLTADGKPVALAADGSFGLEVSLREQATVELRLQAVDAAGLRSEELRRTITRAPPIRALRITEPPPGRWLRGPEVTVKGVVEPPDALGGLTLDGRPLARQGGGFEATVTATGDGPLELTVRGLDGDGVVAEAQAVVHVDATPPAVDPEELAARLVVGRTLGLLANGFVEDAGPRQVELGSRRAQVTDSGWFELFVAPGDGPALAGPLVAVDQAGNRSAGLAFPDPYEAPRETVEEGRPLFPVVEGFIAGLAAARKAGRPLLLIVTCGDDRCPPMRGLIRSLYRAPDGARLLERCVVARLRGRAHGSEGSRPSPEAQAFLTRYDVEGTPAFFAFSTSGSGRLLESTGDRTPQALLDALAAAEPLLKEGDTRIERQQAAPGAFSLDERVTTLTEQGRLEEALAALRAEPLETVEAWERLIRLALRAGERPLAHAGLTALAEGAFGAAGLPPERRAAWRADAVDVRVPDHRHEPGKRRRIALLEAALGREPEPSAQAHLRLRLAQALSAPPYDGREEAALEHLWWVLAQAPAAPDAPAAAVLYARQAGSKLEGLEAAERRRIFQAIDAVRKAHPGDAALEEAAAKLEPLRPK